MGRPKLTNEQKRQNRIDKWHERFRHPVTIHRVFNGSKSNPEFGVAVNLQKLVRLANADNDGMCECICCGVRLHWSVMNGGHFLTRTRLSTIIDPRNVHPQRVYCNKERGGNVAEYRKALVRKYGEESVEELERLSHQKRDWNRYELAEIKVNFLDEIAFHEKRLGIT